MTRIETAIRDLVWDICDLPDRGDPWDLEQRTHTLIRMRPELPTVRLVTPVPQLHDGDPRAEATLAAGLADVLGVVREGEFEVRRGGPPPNPYVCAEIAYMLDIERKPLHGREEGADFIYEVRNYLNRVLTTEVITWREGSARSKTVSRWRDRGRHLLAELGAWPWALEPKGRLARTWWRDPRFGEALAAWFEHAACEGA